MPVRSATDNRHTAIETFRGLLFFSGDDWGRRTLPLILANRDWSVRVEGVELNIYHRMVLGDGHCLYLPEQEKMRPDHTMHGSGLRSVRSCSAASRRPINGSCKL